MRPSRRERSALSVLPDVNFGTVAAGMCTFWPGFRGLTPMRALRSDVENLPKPVKFTVSRRLSASVIVSSTASTALAASPLPRPLLSVPRRRRTLAWSPRSSSSGLDGQRGGTYHSARFPLNHAAFRNRPPADDFRRTKQGMQAHAEARKGVRTALLPVDDADGRAAFQGSLPYCSDGICGCTARCDHIFDQNDTISWLVGALQLVGGAVLLRLCRGRSGTAAARRARRPRPARPRRARGRRAAARPARARRPWPRGVRRAASSSSGTVSKRYLSR